MTATWSKDLVLPGLLSLLALTSGVTSQTIGGRHCYSNVTEHCDSLWNFTGTQDAPTVVTNVTYYPANATDGTPAFCDVLAQIDTYNGAAFRLPAKGADWDGIYHMMGCGGPCGYRYMDTYWSDLGGWSWSRDLLQRGYMTSTTDMGHVLDPNVYGFNSFWNNRTAEINFAYKASHQLVVAGKAMAKEYYGTPHRLSFYRGSSTGGRQGLVAAQRYPFDFDGIVIGHPASNETAIGSIQENYLGVANKAADGTHGLYPNDLPPLNEVALASCDHLDGLVDGLIDNADRCVIDWGLIDCTSPRKIINDTACFDEKKMHHAKKLYDVPRDSNGYKVITSSVLPGSELSWDIFEFYVTKGDYDSACYNGSQSFNVAAAFEEDLPLDWKPEEYDYDEMPPKLRFMEQLYSGMNTDLRPFFQNGGKMIMTQGWYDYNVTPQFTVKYWLDLLRTYPDAVLGHSPSLHKNARLFMTNGQYHTWGTGPGATSSLHLSDLIHAWREHGVAPDKIVGQKLSEDRTEVLFERPAFPYPYYASYTGGDWKSASNFEPKHRDWALEL